VRPLLSPQIIGKKQPFPFLKSKDIYAVVVLEKKNRDKLGIVPCNLDVIPRLVRIPGHENRFMLREELILHYISLIFDRYKIKSKSLIRIIRNADIDPDEEMYDDDTDFRQVMEQLVSRRRKLCPIKLEYTRLMDESVLDTLCGYLDLKKKHIFHSEAPLDLSFFSRIRDLMRNKKELFYDKYTPQIPADIDMSESIMKQVEQKDRFLFFPYDSMQPFLRMLNEAAEDPSVVSIKMTLYRVANDSKVVEALINAAENGKEVVALVELRARFDEENNIEWSRRLEDAGCRILYGLDKLKVHSKLCLITKKQEGHISYITQIGTGNYNEKTAKLYTDFSLLTAHQGIGEEANEVFHKLCLGQVMQETKYLMVAPKCLRNKILDKMDEQIALAKRGEPGYIGAKMNSLTDKRIIEKLMEASQAGVDIELIVRGSCCLIAGVPGVTEHITVRSIVGRYLEHSRIYIFGNDEVYIASADFMTRNTTRRVEVATPIYDEDIKKRVLHIFNVIMSDNVKARVQMADGQYVRAVQDGEPINAQKYFETMENR
ncbi:MAG: polyphosphate kinase 1, partial [Lachnospiraceae bacterium]|nr:polyphosphate kinase 1 [Lachnospiraceae bacterium]